MQLVEIMKLKSLIQYKNRLQEAEVEIKLISGIPQIHFTGLADRQIKESFYRIKSALKSSGYQFPTTQQVIVNIKPNHIQKSSSGIELAVALGILLQTEQIPQETISTDWIIYGELGLDGEVFEPNDLYKFVCNYTEDKEILSGLSNSSKTKCRQMQHLSQPTTKLNPNYTTRKNIERPLSGLQKMYSATEADFLFLMSVGRFHALLAGDAGAGKSTLARSLLSFLPAIQNKNFHHVDNWYSLVAPHHSVTQAAFIGGGVQLFEGELERVSGGLLLLDELLEFKPEIIETLRGPMAGEPLRLARGASEREIASDFQVIATTNLCPCGMWTPLKKNLSCRFSRTRCRKYLDKLSGPIVDRFGLILFLHGKNERMISGNEVLKRIESFENRTQPENKILEIRKTFYSELSERRWTFLKRISLIWASEDKLEINMQHFKKSEPWALTPFIQLAKGMD